MGEIEVFQLYVADVVGVGHLNGVFIFFLVAFSGFRVSYNACSRPCFLPVSGFRCNCFRQDVLFFKEHLQAVLPDWRDDCPNTPETAWGYVDERGCELDTDGDGVPDWSDNCPTVPGLKENKGCPALKKEVKNLLKKAMQGIQFETGKATIKPVSFNILNDIAKVFIDNPTYQVEVQGHTDNVGKPAFNMQLSDKRAQSVRKYLVEHGVPENQLTAKGYGDTKPIESNKTAKGRALNRRVEFDITFEEVKIEEIMDQVQPAQTDSIQPTDSLQQQPAVVAEPAQ